MLWIESPAGVGWSWAGTEEDFVQNDMLQSEDALVALNSFYAKFPMYRPNKLFVTGESYAGIYVPYLSWQIYNQNERALKDKTLKHINLEGFIVGNGCTNWSYDVEPAMPATFANFNLIPMDLYETLNVNNCTYYFREVYEGSSSPICINAWTKAMELTMHLNIYDLYRPELIPGNNNTMDEMRFNRYGETEIGGKMHTYKRGMTAAEYTPWARSLFHQQPAGTIYGDFISDYMNRADVRAAFNIPDKVGPWEQCSGKIWTGYKMSQECSQWIYPILKNKVRMMFYSGDTDGIVPTYGSKQWIKELNWPVTDKWRAWETHGQVSGFVQKYEGLEFWTVKGTGHMAPQWKREPVTDMITAFIHNEPL